MEDEQKSSYWKFVGAFMVLVILGLTAFVASRIYALREEQQIQSQQLVALKQAQDETTQSNSADTYGGKTPQETLSMYTDAVAKGDYVLASKYFTPDLQEQELHNFLNASTQELSAYVVALKQLESTQGNYSEDGATFIVTGPATIMMIKSQSGVWKMGGR
jgi:hypothetical protein